MQAVFDWLAQAPAPLLIVGGHALSAHGVFRQTIDIDCLIAGEDQEILAAEFTRKGYALTASSANFARYAAGSPDLPEIDLLLVDRATFEKLQTGSIPLQRGAHQFRVPGLPQLIALKLHAIRNEPRREARDLSDIAELLRLNSGLISKADLGGLCQQFGPPGIESKLVGLV